MKTGLQDLLSRESVSFNLRATSKKQLLQELSERAGAQFDIDQRAIFDALIDREDIGATGVGEGVAIPHARMTGLDKIHGLFAKLEKPVDFDAVDDAPVDLVFLLLAPEDACADHLKVLSKVSRVLRDPQMRGKLRGADSADALLSILTEPVARAA